METTTTEADWRAALAPWMETLEYKLWINEPPLAMREKLEEMWIILQVPELDDFAPARWTRVLEALELLDLLVRVDPQVGWGLLFSVSQRQTTFDAYEKTLFRRDRVIPRYRFESLDSELLQENVDHAFRALGRMVGDEEEPWQTPSPGFGDLKQKLLDAWQLQHGGLDFDRAREGRIQVAPRVTLSTSPDDEVVSHIMDETLGLARASRLLDVNHRPENAVVEDEVRLATRRHRALFSFVSFDFEVIGHPVTDEILYGIYKVHKLGVPVKTVKLDQVLTSQLNCQVTGGFFMQVLGAWQPEGRDLSQFEWTGGEFDAQAVSAICSGMIMSQSLKEFAFLPPRGCGRRRHGDAVQPPRPVNLVAVACVDAVQQGRQASH